MKKIPQLSDKPQKITEKVWYYEEHDGLCVVDYLLDHESEVEKFAVLPWKMVCASVDRYRVVEVPQAGIELDEEELVEELKGAKTNLAAARVAIRWFRRKAKK